MKKATKTKESINRKGQAMSLLTNTRLNHDYHNQIKARIPKFPFFIRNEELKHGKRIWNDNWIPGGQYSVINHSSKSKKEPIDHTPCSLTKEENTNVTQRASNNRDIIIISWYMLSSLKPMNSFSLNHSCVRVKHLGKKKKQRWKNPPIQASVVHFRII